jgi:hypothetical protein
MAIPKYAFQVETHYFIGSRFEPKERKRSLHNYETLDGAYAYSSMMLRKPNTLRVRILMVIDDKEVMRA